MTENNERQATEVLDRMTTAIGVLVNNIQSVFDDLGKWFQEQMPAVLGVMEAFRLACYTAYVEDGAIYGPTDDGMMRWLREKSEAAHARTKAEEIEQRQEMIRELKRKLAIKEPQP